MSYILDALRKAERERNLGRPPDLRSVPVQEPPRRNLAGVLVLALLVNAVLAGYLVWQRPWAQSEPQAAAVPAAPVAESAPQPAAVEPPAATLATAPQPDPLPVATEPSPEAIPLPADEPPPAGPAIDSPEPVAVIDLLPPPLHTMPAPFRQALPALNLDVHVYSEQPERRFVIINSAQYRIGEPLREGPLLEDIASEGAVLSFLGERFLLPVAR